MDLKKLFELQKEIDEKIFNTSHLDKISIERIKHLSLLSKIGSISELTFCEITGECDEAAEKETLIKKFSDCLSCILTIGLEHNYIDVIIDRENKIDDDLAQTFINIYLDVNELLIVSSKDSYEELFKDFMTLARLLNIDRLDIVKEYEIRYEELMAK